MDTMLIAGRILGKFEERGESRVNGYNRFVFQGWKGASVVVLREKGTKSLIPVAKLFKVIDMVKHDSNLYDAGPSSLRPQVTHLNSPLWSLIHMLPKSAYR